MSDYPTNQKLAAQPHTVLSILGRFERVELNGQRHEWRVFFVGVAMK